MEDKCKPRATGDFLEAEERGVKKKERLLAVLHHFGAQAISANQVERVVQEQQTSSVHRGLILIYVIISSWSP